jgi:hypothetical protein
VAPAGSQDASLQVGRLKLWTRVRSAKQLGADAEACAGAHTCLECEHGLYHICLLSYMPQPHLEPDGEQGLVAPAGSQDVSLQVGRLKL